MSAHGTSRTWEDARCLTGFGGKADIEYVREHVRENFLQKFLDAILAVRCEKHAMGPRLYKGIGGARHIRSLGSLTLDADLTHSTISRQSAPALFDDLINSH